MKPLLNGEIKLRQAWQFLTNDKSWQSHYEPSISLVWAQFKFLNILLVGCTLFLKITQLACIKTVWWTIEANQTPKTNPIECPKPSQSNAQNKTNRLPKTKLPSLHTSLYLSHVRIEMFALLNVNIKLHFCLFSEWMIIQKIISGEDCVVSSSSF